MLKEIMEQPAAVRAAIAPRIRDGEIHLDDFDLSAEELRTFNKIIITACGSAYYAGCAGKYALESLCRIPVEVALASELRYGDPLIDEHTLLIVLSQSGETADTIAAMKECRRKGAKVLAIVNVVGSTIAKTADWTLYTFAGPEIAVATTKGYTTQLAVLYLLAMDVSRKLGRLDDERYAVLLYDILRLPKLIQNAIDLNHGLPALAKKYHNSPSLFFIGRNTDWAVALEGALKMKEISYIHAESYAAGELKHGTIALIEEGTPVIAVCCNALLADKTISNIVEVKARGARVLAVAFRDDRKIVSQANGHSAAAFGLLCGKGERLRHRQAQEPGKVRHGGIKTFPARTGRGRNDSDELLLIRPEGSQRLPFPAPDPVDVSLKVPACNKPCQDKLHIG